MNSKFRGNSQSNTISLLKIADKFGGKRIRHTSFFMESGIQHNPVEELYLAFVDSQYKIYHNFFNPYISAS
jgi:hypothetical protein